MFFIGNSGTSLAGFRLFKKIRSEIGKESPLESVNAKSSPASPGRFWCFNEESISGWFSSHPRESSLSFESASFIDIVIPSKNQNLKWLSVSLCIRTRNYCGPGTLQYSLCGGPRCGCGGAWTRRKRCRRGSGTGCGACPGRIRPGVSERNSLRDTQCDLPSPKGKYQFALYSPSSMNRSCSLISALAGSFS